MKDKPWVYPNLLIKTQLNNNIWQSWAALVPLTGLVYHQRLDKLSFGKQVSRELDLVKKSTKTAKEVQQLISGCQQHIWSDKMGFEDFFKVWVMCFHLVKWLIHGKLSMEALS